MRHHIPSSAAPLLALLLFGLAGCVKFKQQITLQPDGSGKMHLSIAIDEAMLTAAGDQDPFEDFSIEALIQQEATGWAAFTEPRIHQADGFRIVAFTGYFRDINRVRFGSPRHPGGAGLGPGTTFRLNEGRLTVTGGIVAQLISEMGQDPSLNDPATRAMMTPLLQGLEIQESYELPGPVQTAAGYTVQGRAATLTVDSAQLLGTPRFTVAELEDGTAQILFTPVPTSAESQNAWQTELAAAETAWTSLKKQAAAQPVPAP